MSVMLSAKKRRALIGARVLEAGEIDFSSLAAEYGVSEMTIRRDIDELEAKGIVRRIIGGAISLRGKTDEPAFESRLAEASLEKTRLAEAAVELLKPAETVLLDSGSTVLAVARAIRGRDLGLTVITPSILIALELAAEPDTTVILAGGRVRPGELSLIGPDAIQAFSMYNCDTYVMGVAGVDGRRGATEYHDDEGSVKRAAARSADRVILVVDHHKLGRVQLVNVLPLEEIDVILTDGAPDDPTLVAAAQAGADVVLVPSGE